MPEKNYELNSSFKTFLDRIYKEVYSTSLQKTPSDKSISISDWNNLVTYVEHLLQDMDLVVHTFKKIPDQVVKTVEYTGGSYSVYGTDGTAQVEFTIGDAEGDIVRRDSDGYVKVPNTAENANDYAINRGQVKSMLETDIADLTKTVNDTITNATVTTIQIDPNNDSVYKFTFILKNSSGKVLASKELDLSGISEELDGYVKKRTGVQNTVYGVDVNGNETNFRVSDDTYENSVVLRDSRGHVKVPKVPTDSTDAISKDYFDTSLVDIDERVSFLESASLVYLEDSSTAYRKIVPVYSKNKASILRVGGMSYKCKYDNTISNLESYNSISDVQVTIADGNITVENPSGKTGWLNFAIYEEYSDIIAPDRWFKLLGDTSGIKNAMLETIYFDDELGEDVNEPYYVDDLIPSDRNIAPGGAFSILLYEGQLAPFTFKPILTTTEDVFEDLRDTKVTELVSEGVNLIPLSSVPTGELKGVTFTINDDGSFTANGTANAVGGFALNTYAGTEFPKGNYTLSGVSDGSSTTYYLQPYFDNVSQRSVTDAPVSYVFNGSTVSIRFFFKEGAVFNNLTIQPMFNRGTVAAPYKPYRAEAVDRFVMPVIDGFVDGNGNKVEGVGRGVEGYPNYIDFERKVFVQNTYRKVFDGTEAFYTLGEVADGTYRIAYALPKTAQSSTGASISPILASSYDTVTAGGGIWYSKNGIALNEGGTHIFIYDKNFNDGDASTWKAHLAELYASGKPLIVEYALAEPIEVDLSTNPFIENNALINVEGGGSIVFDNDNKYDAPSSIGYVTLKGD